MLVRTATALDAAEISAVIVSTLVDLETTEYAADFIANLEASFAPEKILERIETPGRLTLVAASEGRLVGTASLE